MSTESNVCLLDRHYSTIGIGDVFVTNPPHELPSSYLSLKQQQKTSTFDSWEITGSIKTKAEDFVVREIACDEKNHHHASRVAVLESLTCNTPTIRIPARATSEGAHSNDRVSKDTCNVPEIKTSENVDERSLLQILSHDAFRNSPSETIEKLNTLHEKAVDLLSGKSDDSSEVVDIILAETGSDDASVSLRSALHQAIRREYPLLQSETKPAGPDQFRCIYVAISTRFFALRDFLDNPREDLLKLYRFFNSGYEASIKEHGDNRVLLSLRQDVPRNDRRTAHEVIRKGSNAMFQTSTIPDFKLSPATTEEPVMVVVIAVQWSKQTGKKRKRDQDPASKTNILFVLRKSDKEHLTTIHTLARALRCRQADIGVAGIKDMRAITYQFCTVSNVNSKQLLNAAALLAKQGIDIGPPKEVPWRLEKGDLRGNHFQITLRNLRRIYVVNGIERTKPLNTDHFLMMVSRIRKEGFINFFGAQRVGVPGTASITGVRSFDIGRAILQCEFSKAVDLIMRGRLVTRGDDVESDDIVRFRQEWKNNSCDLDRCWKALPKGGKLLREQTVLQGLKRYGVDKPIEALRCLHRNERTMWVSSYQSYVWNIAASERLRLYGKKVVQGDLVDVEGHVELVNDANLKEFNIYHVVLPLVGTSSILPQNAVRSTFEDILKNDGISFPETAPSDALPKGGYRHLLARCENLEFEMQEKDTEQNIRVVTLSFGLTKGCYATSLLRELMVTTIDRTFITATDQLE